MRGVMVHGRFQPFHNEHLDYVKEGLRRSEGTLVVGITNPFPDQHPERCFSEEDHRHNREANPYSFLSRASMVQRSLAAESADLSRVLIIPFHLDMLEQYSVFAGELDFLVNVLEKWDEEKCNRFSAAGLSVIRYHRPRTMSGSEVRSLISTNREIGHLVPTGSLSVLKELDKSQTAQV